MIMLPHRMPRKSFLKVLQAGVGAAEAITVLPNASCSEIRKTDEGGLQVSTDDYVGIIWLCRFFQRHFTPGCGQCRRH